MEILKEKFKFIDNNFIFYNASLGIQPFLIEQIRRLYSKDQILLILQNNEEIDKFLPLFKLFSYDSELLDFPAWDCMPYDDISPTKSIINRRFKTFKQREKIRDKPCLILTSIDALIQKVPITDEIKKLFLKFTTKCSYNIIQIRKDLQDLGYKRVNLVLEPNEYAIRGGIIDIWPLGEAVPYRLDFFGDQLDEIKIFNPISQIANTKVNSILIESPIEVPLNDINVENFVTNYRKIFGPVVNKDLLIHTIKTKHRLEGVEHWLPLFYSTNLVNLFNFFNPSLVIAKNDLLSMIKKKIKEIQNIYNEKSTFYEENRDENNGPLTPNKLYVEELELSQCLQKINKCFIEEIDLQHGINTFNIKSSDNLEFLGQRLTRQQVVEKVEKILKKYLNNKKMIFCFNNEEGKKYINTILSNFPRINLRSTSKDIKSCLDNLSIVDLLFLPLETGFETDLIKLISIQEIIDLKNTTKEKKFKNNISDLSQLNLEDFVVHRDHGIGKYLGLKTISILEKPHDCLVIEYLNESKLYVPVENINLISKYGSSLSHVELDKLGSQSWNKRKSAVKNKIRDLANTLITNAAKRNLHKSKKMDINNINLDHFSKEFSYIETEDQLATLTEVYKDLSSGYLMDRLVCGDVGFGKTEIALRATFVVTQNELNTLVIVPSTLLARQHYETFKKRFKNFAEVEIITRFTNISKKKMLIDEFCKSKIKILICTHSIFTADLKEANLGLIIVDEEQHFGVAQKEKIKRFKTNVNILTLTATPIPRTLYMSLLGIRELSLIKTPPVDRKAVKTYISKFEKSIIYRSIKYELDRNGQIFFVVPKIKNIDDVHKKIKVIHPHLKIGIAHGKLKTNEIENVMSNFVNKKIDLLISTSIIEAGLDIPSANTLIVYKADYFGLAQLHQLRGRIGRGKIKGFAYFTIEKSNITENATRRLKALKAMDKLGAGINLANYDLDIRGAGNLLGEEQSGQIIQVGIELYQKLLKECLSDLKNEKKETLSSSVEINIKLPILIPEQYIPDLSLRLSLYRKLGEINDFQELNVYKQEIKNRFGNIPVEFNNLIEIISLKILCGKANIVKLNITNKKFFIFFDKKFKNYSDNFIKWITSNKSSIILNNTHNIEFLHHIEEPENQLLNVIELINKIIILLENE